ncbi:MAG: hypothetical protein R3C68_15465 [Myxococcota bacterium]
MIRQAMPVLAELIKDQIPLLKEAAVLLTTARKSMAQGKDFPTTRAAMAATS